MTSRSTSASWIFSLVFSRRSRHTRCLSDWSSDVCSSDLVEAGHLPQHARVRAGHARDAEHANQGASHEDVEVMDGDGDLSELAFCIAGYEKNIKAFSQNCTLC